MANLCNIIERWSLTRYDVRESLSADTSEWYRVRKTWSDASSQKGAFKILDNAQNCADANPGYSVFDDNGKVVYVGKNTVPDVPFLVKVNITDLNIRKGPGTNYIKTGKYTGIGVLTIMEVRSGQGSTAGWGRLKSSAGWISLDFAARV